MSDSTLTCLRVGQWLYWAALFCMWIGFLLPLVRERSLSSAGALLGFVGTFMLFGGTDAVVSAFIGWMTQQTEWTTRSIVPDVWHPLVALDVAPAMVIGVTGAVLCWLTEDSAFFVRPDGRAAWYRSRRKWQERAMEAATFKPFGEVVDSRLVRRNMSTITEIETANGVVAIAGRITSIRNGLTVYTNEFGDVRVGALNGRTFKRREVQQALTNRLRSTTVGTK